MTLATVDVGILGVWSTQFGVDSGHIIRDIVVGDICLVVAIHTAKYFDEYHRVACVLCDDGTRGYVLSKYLRML